MQLTAEMVRTGKSLQELASVMTVYPQVLINVTGVDRLGLAGDSEIDARAEQLEAELGEHGRILLRPSGTEKIIRVMVEAQEEYRARQVAEELAALIKERLGV